MTSRIAEPMAQVLQSFFPAMFEGCVWCRDRGHYSVTVGSDPSPVEIICSHCDEGRQFVGRVTAAELDAMAECPKCENGVIEYDKGGGATGSDFCPCEEGQEAEQKHDGDLEVKGAERWYRMRL